MKGLLYKDFIACKGKIVCAILFIILFGFFCLRLCFQGTQNIWMIMFDNESSNVYLNDIILYFIFSSVASILLMGPLLITKYLFSQEEKSKSQIYFRCMPFSKNEYVASKYITYLFMYYVIYSCIQIMKLIYLVTATNVEMIQKVKSLGSISGGVIFILLLIHAIQFPGYFLYGAKKADEINGGLIGILMIILVPFFLFMDFAKIDIDIEVFILNYTTVLTSIGSIALPVILYVSYRFTVKRLGIERYKKKAL